MQLEEVKDKKTRKAFLELPVSLYKDEQNWIRPWDKDVEAVFDPDQNKLFRHGSCIRWILKNDQGATIGRVAAFINEKTAYKYEQPTGGMGFFECINDQQAAFMLFDACKAWLEERGMKAMNGPINFGERDKWWGLLIHGFDYEPNYCMPYNFQYYQDFFEAYGFYILFKQYTYAMKVHNPLPEHVNKKAKRIKQTPDYKFINLDLKKLDSFVDDFVTIYNKAWAKHEGVGQIKKAQAMMLFKQLKPIIDESIIWFGYYDDEPIAFFISIPQINQIIKHLNGKFNLLAKLRFFLHQKMHTCNKMFGVAFGVIPEFQGRGVEGALINASSAVQKNDKYIDFEMNWIGDFNPKMMRLAESLGAYVAKTHATYRYIFK